VIRAVLGRFGLAARIGLSIAAAVVELWLEVGDRRAGQAAAVSG